MRVLGLILLLFNALSTEAFTVRGPAIPLVVRVGASVTLPCSADTRLPLSELQVQWMKEDSGTLVHLFQEGESRPKSQSASYSGRAKFSPEEISKGNFSLLLINVTTEDKGLYKCVVRTDNESSGTMMEIDIERLVLTGAVKPVSAYAGEDVILNCSVDTDVPVGELRVQWIKINGEILVLLFDEGESRPESQDERFRGRAEFFSEEIPKGNFSMKLRDVKTEDKGEFMCRVDGGNRESVNATAWLQELGFSSLHLLVLVFAISSAVVALSINICALWCIMTEDQSNRSCLCCLHDSVPCILIAIAFVVWGVTENSFVEGFVCGAINFLRILVIFKMAPYKKLISGSYSWRLANLALPLEYVVIATGANSDVLHRTLKHQDPSTAGKALLGCFFGGIVLCGLLAVLLASGSSSGHVSRRTRRTVTSEATAQELKIHWIVLYFLLISSGCAVVFLTWTHVAGIIAVVLIVLAVFCLFGASLQYLCRSCLSRKKYKCICLNFLHIFIFIILIATVFSLLNLIFERDKERPVWMCLYAFLFILTAAAPFQQGSNYPAALQIPVYVFGSVVLSAVNSAALASDVIFKSEKGKRNTGDLRLIVLPFESVFLACWFGLQLYIYWEQEKEE